MAFSSVLKVLFSARRASRWEGNMPALVTSQRMRLRQSEP